ncbi:MAG: SCO family protein [Ignavibacteriaceae bacterium]
MKLLENILLLMLLSFFSKGFADERIKVGVDEQLGSTLPLEINFYDEEGNKVKLGSYFDKPVVLAFVYYKCPGICSPLLFSLAEVINKTDLIPGEDYEIVTISMDNLEDYKIAGEKKKDFVSMLDNPGYGRFWHFLTGDSLSIAEVTEAAGFRFKREGDQFRHAGTFIFISKDGKICRYLFPGYTDRSGFGILPFDMKMAVLEATEGKETPTIARVLQFCFAYDPEGDRYVLNFTRIFGAGILLLAIGFVIFIKLKPKKENEFRGKEL